MLEIIHDPSEYVRGIYQILINSKKRIGFLFGAGTSLAIKDLGKSLVVPGIIDLTNQIMDEIDKELDDKGNKIYEELIRSLKEDLEDKFNIEIILSNLEQKCLVLGKSTLSGLNKDDYFNLIIKIKRSIRNKVSVHLKDKIAFESLIQSDFARWIGQADRAFGIEIFTTNYDLLFELGLEHNHIPYYDGFTGSYRPFYYDDSVEKFNFLPFQTKLWKIHGSIGWHADENNDTIIRDNSNKDDIIIYPSVYKYQDSKKQPYISLLDRLSNFLLEDDTVLFTCGYSFNDMHINQRIMSALNADKNSHVIALYWDEYKNESDPQLHYSLGDSSHLYKLAMSNSKLSVLGFRSAIIGRHFGKWKLIKEPDIDETPNVNLYFDEDVAIGVDAELKKEYKGNEKWIGEGKFLLPNFIYFVNFLNSMIHENSLSEAIKDGIR
jgi:SIR2-like domain